MRRVRGVVVLAACALCGCSGKPTEGTPTGTVEGKVVHQGRPVPFVMVTLNPQNPADPNRYDGATAQDGSFRVQCPKGSYKVTLNPLPAGPGGDPGAGGLVGGAPDAKGLKEIPLPYRGKASTPLTVDVPEGGRKGVTLEVK